VCSAVSGVVIASARPCPSSFIVAGIGRAWLVLVAHCSAISRWAATNARLSNNTDRQAKEQAALEQLRQQRVSAGAQRRTG